MKQKTLMGIMNIPNQFRRKSDGAYHAIEQAVADTYPIKINDEWFSVKEFCEIYEVEERL